MNSSQLNLSSQVNLSVRSEASSCPKELYGFVYDIPKDAQLTNAQLTEIFREQHIQCQTQICRDEKKPFYSARVKFMNSVHLEVATKKLSCFKLDTPHGHGRICRFLPFVSNLSKNPSDRNPEHHESAPELENMPDNTQQLTNLCVKGLDHSLTEADLHIMFRQFGEIVSAKVARDPATS